MSSGLCQKHPSFNHVSRQRHESHGKCYGAPVEQLVSLQATASIATAGPHAHHRRQPPCAKMTLLGSVTTWPWLCGIIKGWPGMACRHGGGVITPRRGGRQERALQRDRATHLVGHRDGGCRGLGRRHAQGPRVPQGHLPDGREGGGAGDDEGRLAGPRGERRAHVDGALHSLYARHPLHARGQHDGARDHPARHHDHVGEEGHAPDRDGHGLHHGHDGLAGHAGRSHDGRCGSGRAEGESGHVRAARYPYVTTPARGVGGEVRPCMPHPSAWRRARGRGLPPSAPRAPPVPGASWGPQRP